MRHLPVTRWTKGGPKRTYRDLGVFNRVCNKGRSLYGTTTVCTLKNLRCMKNGEGLATILSDTDYKEPSTWRLHFASCDVMKDHLYGRVADPPKGVLVTDADHRWMVEADRRLERTPNMPSHVRRAIVKRMKQLLEK